MRKAMIAVIGVAVLAAIVGVAVYRVHESNVEARRSAERARAQHDALVQERFQLRDAARQSESQLNSTQAAWDRLNKEISAYALTHSFTEPLTDGNLVTAKMMMEDETKTKIEWPDLGGAAHQFAVDKAALDAFDRAHIGIAQELGYKPGEWK